MSGKGHGGGGGGGFRLAIPKGLLAFVVLYLLTKR